MQLDGIGFQGHIGGFPNSIYEVYNTLEDFYATFGLTAKITEYDTDEAVDDELAATYLRDFLTIVFSHESTDGFLMWGFWDGAHWHGNAPLFYQDWSLKPAGEAFIDMVFNEWWTQESGQTNSSGFFTTRGFKGTYKITIDCGEEVLTDTIVLNQDTEIIKSEGGLSVGVSNTPELAKFRLYPNPASDFLKIEKQASSRNTQVYIFDASGRMVLRADMPGKELTIPVDFGTGAFKVVLKSGKYQASETIIIQ